jgi:heme/copper-type cytochrome/quinol oxidase subunit 2
MQAMDAARELPILETPRSPEARSFWHAAKSLWPIVVSVLLTVSVVFYWLARMY